MIQDTLKCTFADSILTVCFLVPLLCLPSAARAHIREIVWDPGQIQTSLALTRSGARLLYTVPIIDLKEAGYSDFTGFFDEVSQGLNLTNDGSPCRINAMSVTHDPRDRTYWYELNYACDEILETVYLSDHLFEGTDYVNRVSVHIDFNTLRVEMGESLREIEIPVGFLLWEQGWELPDTLPALEKPSLDLLSYFDEGFRHVITGYDHMAFLLGLMLLVTQLRKLAILITAFTLAHSITLGLSGTDILTVPAAFTEVAIALSIIYVGIENLLSLRNGNAAPAFARRWVTTFFFGLIHGFGFSFMLRELGLPDDAQLPALLLFNLGVEAGQLAVVIIPFLALRWCVSRWQNWYWPGLVGSTTVILLGVNWLYMRVAVL